MVLSVLNFENVLKKYLVFCCNLHGAESAVECTSEELNLYYFYKLVVHTAAILEIDFKISVLEILHFN